MTDAKKVDATEVDMAEPRAEHEPRTNDRADVDNTGVDRTDGNRMNTDTDRLDTHRTDTDRPNTDRTIIAGSDEDRARTGGADRSATDTTSDGTGPDATVDGHRGPRHELAEPTGSESTGTGSTAGTWTDAAAAATSTGPRAPGSAAGETEAAHDITFPGADDSTGPRGTDDAGLIAAVDIDRYRNDWRSLQSGFVDDPAGAVRDADALVGKLFDTISSRISERRSALSDHRSDGSMEHTERLRQALRGYRTLFEQLLPSRDA